MAHHGTSPLASCHLLLLAHLSCARVTCPEEHPWHFSCPGHWHWPDQPAGTCAKLASVGLASNPIDMTRHGHGTLVTVTCRNTTMV